MILPYVVQVSEKRIQCMSCLGIGLRKWKQHVSGEWPTKKQKETKGIIRTGSSPQQQLLDNNKISLHNVILCYLKVHVMHQS